MTAALYVQQLPWFVYTPSLPVSVNRLVYQLVDHSYILRCCRRRENHARERPGARCRARTGTPPSNGATAGHPSLPSAIRAFYPLPARSLPINPLQKDDPSWEIASSFPSRAPPHQMPQNDDRPWETSSRLPGSRPGAGSDPHHICIALLVIYLLFS